MLSVELFKSFVDKYQSREDYRAPIGFGIARVDLGQISKKVLQVVYPVLNWKIGRAHV